MNEDKATPSTTTATTTPSMSGGTKEDVPAGILSYPAYVSAHSSAHRLGQSGNRTGRSLVLTSSSTAAATVSPTPTRERNTLRAGVTEPASDPGSENDEPHSRPFSRSRTLARLSRWLNFILGPGYAHPPRPPPPSTFLAFSYTLPTVRPSTTIPLDPYPVRLTRYLRLHYFLIPFLCLWAMGFVLLVRAQYYLPSSPELITCDSAYWNDWPPDTCGVNGTGCESDLVSSYFRCPGGCTNVVLGNPRWVGDDDVNSVPLIIGGGDDNHTYRADSWICSAGVHAGLVSPTFGGCVNVNVLSFPSGSYNFLSSLGGGGLTSILFLPHFPGAFTLSSTGLSSGCIEYHWIATAFSVVCLFLLTLFLSPPPWVLFSILLVLGFLQISLFSDTPNSVPNWSDIIGGILPVLVAGYWIYKVSFAHTLRGFVNLPLETAIFQGAGYWVGVESSTIFARLPISRLGYGGLSSDGIVALVLIVLVVAVVVVLQAWTMRKYGMLQFYLIRYLPLVPILIILANLGNGLVLQIHHYMYALVAFPVLSLPNRISLFGQAFCLGLFVDGVGRWGWQSIIETSTSLAGDSATGSPLPTFLNATADVVNWIPINSTLLQAGISAFSLLLDDIQINNSTIVSNFSVQQAGLDTDSTHYLRIAYVNNDTSTDDYTDPITWSNGSWHF